MARRICLAVCGAILLATAARWAIAADTNAASPASPVPDVAGTAADSVGLFDAIDAGRIDVTFIAKSDRAARILITNREKQPIHLRLPEAFAGVPVLAQFGGGGGGRGGGGFGGGGRGGGGGLGGGGGGQQSVGGGLGGGGGGLGGGGLGGGGGGGIFSIPPEKTAKINVPVVCLDHGLQTPSSSNKYKMIPAEDHLDRPAVVELLKAFGRGELNHAATQAAAWHLNNDLSWPELAAKLQGTRRSPRRPPYFSREEIQAGVAYANEAARLAEANSALYARDKAQQSAGTISDASGGSESRSTTDY
jgi:hypothetical protein